MPDFLSRSSSRHAQQGAQAFYEELMGSDRSAVPRQRVASNALHVEQAEQTERHFRSPRFQGDAVLLAVLNGRRTLRRGQRGQAIRKLQRALLDLGYPLPRSGEDGDFGSETRRAVLSFQRSPPAVSADGVVGPATMGKLDEAIANRRPGPTTPVRPAPGREVIVRQTAVELPLTNQRIFATKVYNTRTGDLAVRATSARGTPVDLYQAKEAEERAALHRYRQVHASLRRAMEEASDTVRLPIIAWIFHEAEPPPKPEQAYGPLLVASADTAEIQRLPHSRVAPDVDTHHRASVGQVLERARESFQRLGVVPGEDLGTAPVLYAEATKAQINQLSQLPEVTGLYLHEPDGLVDLDSSISDARAAAAHAGGFKGAGVKVAIWEQTPANVTDLVIADRFDTSPSTTSNHAQLVTAVIKNTQSAGSHGFAPDCSTYSANSFSQKALVWAVQTANCTVVNQSFHRHTEQTLGDLSADDLLGDYLALRPPFPCIVHAAGNTDSAVVNEYVNHKGFNGMTIGNHEDGATSMRASSVFRNPTSPTPDRELPDLCANGTTVSATGQSMTGTSFSSPAVAGSAAVVQSVNSVLKSWPEGVRAVLLASAGRNVHGGTWAASSSVDDRDGSGALDTREAVKIARKRAVRSGPGMPRGWDVRRVSNTDFGRGIRSGFSYSITVPSTGGRRIKAAIAWNSKVVHTADATAPGGVKVTTSKLTVDLDLMLFHGTNLVASSATFDNSFEILEFEAEPGQTYKLHVYRIPPTTDWVWCGIAWTIF